MTIKRFLASAAIAIAGAATLVTAAPPPASGIPAAPQACTESIRSAQYITYHGEPAPSIPIGAVQLRKDTCGNYWAYVKIYGVPVSSLETVRGWISRWDGGNRTVIESCSIGTGRTECVTPKIRSANSSSLFLASAHYYFEGDLTYWGQTATVR